MKPVAVLHDPLEGDFLDEEAFHARAAAWPARGRAPIGFSRLTNGSRRPCEL